MPQLPQINVRLASDHHDLIRRLAQRLRNDPDFAETLAGMLDTPSLKLDDATPLLARLGAMKPRTAAREDQLSRPITPQTRSEPPAPRPAAPRPAAAVVKP